LIGDDGVMDGQQSIRTARLCLLETSVALLEACATDNLAQAERLLGVSLCEDWQTDKWLWELRLAEAKKDPAFLPWLPRAIVLADSSQLIGHLNFHSAPGPSYLQQIAPGGLELGYTIFAPYRRNGYAEEAVTGLLKWTAKHRGVRHFVFSIRPDNTPSVRIAHKLGFSKIGQHEDEVDGTEDIYSCHWP
jgi:RimJ/RimL family protein N-acetyltransferase